MSAVLFICTEINALHLLIRMVLSQWIPIFPASVLQISPTLLEYHSDPLSLCSLLLYLLLLGLCSL